MEKKGQNGESRTEWRERDGMERRNERRTGKRGIAEREGLDNWILPPW